MKTSRHIPTQLQLGFSTLELLIAFAVMTLSMTAVIMVAFGNQSVAVDTELAQRGLYIAEQNLEEAAAMTIANFDSATSGTSTIAYQATEFLTELAVFDISECAKRIESSAYWDRETRQDLGVSLSSIYISTTSSAALGGDCATFAWSDDWDNPDVFTDEQITGQADATGIDIENEYLYLVTNPGSANNQAEFFVYEFHEGPPITLTLRGERDLGRDMGGANPQKVGLLDVAAAHDFAFVASASTTAQLQVFDVSDRANPHQVAKTQLYDVDPLGSYPAAVTVYYYAEKIYVGTKETDGPEFHIYTFDDSTLSLTHEASLNLDHNVNDIMVRGDFAFLATSDDNHELMAINIDPSNATYMQHPDDTGFGFNAEGGGGHDGTAVYAIGNRVYLGREKGSNNPPKTFYILDRFDVIDGTETADGVLGSEDVGLVNNGSYISGIVIRDRFAFLALESSNIGLVIYNIADPSDILLPAPCSEYNSQQHTTAIDLEGRYVFTANQHNADIQIIHDLEAVCPL